LEILGDYKRGWSGMHVVSSILFAIAGIFHIIYNWTPIVNYVSKKVSAGLRLRKELILATALSRASRLDAPPCGRGASLFVIFGPVYGIPPLNTVIDFGSFLKDQWVVSKDYEPPFGHAEQVSLKTLAKRMNIDFEKAMAELREKGMKIEGGEDSLEKIAKANNTSPMKVYALIKKYEQKQEQTASGGKKVTYTPEMVEEKFAETGVGRKTLAEICKETGVDIYQTKENLRRQGVEMKDDETLKEAATKRKVNPHDLLKAALVENYRLQ
jgi:hypothetical protein